MTDDAPWRPAYIGVGANLDDPIRRVRSAVAALATLPQSRFIAGSRLYDSAPVGFADQPRFINAAAALLTRLEPRELLAALRALEFALGKVTPTVRFGPRRIDLDLLVFADEVIESVELTVPHPRLHERAFVLYPLADIAPELWVPGHGRVTVLAGRVDGSTVTLAREIE